MISDPIEHGGLLVHHDYLDPLRAAGLDSFDALMSAAGETNLDKKGLASWRQRIVLKAGDHTLFLKRYTKPPVREQLRQRIAGFGATAEVERHWLKRMAELGIAAPAVVAYGVRKRGLAETQSLIVTAKVPGISLEKWTPPHIDGKLRDRAFKRRLIDAVAAIVAKLHGAGLFHRDLYLAHLFIDDADDAYLRLALIDLQRVIQPRLFARRRRVKDLASLNYSTPRRAASTADRVRWYKRYRGIDRLMAADRTLIRAVVAKTKRIAQHSTKHRLG